MAPNLSILGLSKKEEKVLLSLREGRDTPLAISRLTHVSRPAIYAILQNLKKRGIVESRIREGRKFWRLCERREIEQNFFQAKRALLGMSEGTEEVFGVDDAVVTIHRGKDAVKKVLAEMLLVHKNERLYGFQGDVENLSWSEVFSVAETSAFNRAVKKNSILVEAILPTGWFERQTKQLGVDWAKDFEGRTTRVSTIDPDYFRHGGQMFVFRESLYLFALGEEIIIEIRHSEIQKMILAMFRFVQENARTIDANAILRKLIAEGSSQNSKGV